MDPAPVTVAFGTVAISPMEAGGSEPAGGPSGGRVPGIDRDRITAPGR
jgi:hypothetical protein